jgi:hypothetical protein
VLFLALYRISGSAQHHYVLRNKGMVSLALGKKGRKEGDGRALTEGSLSLMAQPIGDQLRLRMIMIIIYN